MSTVQHLFLLVIFLFTALRSVEVAAFATPKTTRTHSTAIFSPSPQEVSSSPSLQPLAPDSWTFDPALSSRTRSSRVYSSGLAASDNGAAPDGSETDDDVDPEEPESMTVAKAIRVKLRKMTGFSFTAIRVSLRQITGFSFTAVRTALRAATGISLTAIWLSTTAATGLWIRKSMAVVLSLFPAWFRYFLQPFLVLYYAPLVFLRSITSPAARSRDTYWSDVQSETEKAEQRLYEEAKEAESSDDKSD
eukprot:CAMPEP_0198114946 /NCGR_PEP_ID=MMETSP1442-20131203/6182_1 /TAXON_ID= /ORGANISM="Craspedostauros australis, Strain CCMP3328" /LENGTH=247 /DNA_ID=CAMNT_0043772357 /DNA_START=191 /DNA_END=934 /DNA_ORIENTATION=-